MVAGRDAVRSSNDGASSASVSIVDDQIVSVVFEPHGGTPRVAFLTTLDCNGSEVARCRERSVQVAQRAAKAPACARDQVARRICSMRPGDDQSDEGEKGGGAKVCVHGFP